MKSLRKKFKFLSVLLALALPSFSLLGDLNNGLVAWYPFDGNASDMSGNGNDLTLHGNPTLIPSNIGGGIRFDGQDDYAVRARLLSSNTPFTWSFWIQENENGVVMCQGHSLAYTPLVELSQANFKLYTYTSVEHSLTLPTSYSNQSEWGHYVAIRDNDGFKRLYQNGVYLGESHNTSAFGQNCNFFYVGGNIGNNLFTKMNLKKIRVYNRTLSAEEVSSVYRLESPNHFAEMNSSVDMEMIWVEPGTFTMGSPEAEAGRNETRETEHNVTLTKGFYLGKYEVTQAQYEAVMTGNTDGLSATPSQFNGNSDRPVEKVSWNDVQVFLERLNQQEKNDLPQGWAYVLPTEAQWEYACRAGTTSAYSWGGTISASDANWDHGNNANQTQDVGSYAPNPWGFFDMHGNVREWTAVFYKAFTSEAKIDPAGPVSGAFRVTRGGSWLREASRLRSADRGKISSSNFNNYVGFRLAMMQITEPPSDLNSTEPLTIAENQSIGAFVGEFNATDPEGGVVTYHFVDGENNNSLFTLDTNGTLITATVFDYETDASSYTIRVQAKDELNAMVEGNFTVTLLDVYEDSDGDGFRDSFEASSGSDVNDATSTPFNHGLVAWYPFDGNASDMSGNGNHGTVNGATLGTDRHGQANKAYSFDGINDWIDLNEIFLDSNFSLSLWVKSPDNDGVIYGTYINHAGYFVLLDSTSSIEYRFANSQSNVSIYADSDRFEAESWNHFLLTHDDFRAKLFVNNKLEASTPNSQLVTSRSSSVNDTLGKASWYHGKYLQGSIDNVRIYDRALSAEEIRLLYEEEAELPAQSVTSAKLSPALSDLIDGNGSLEQALPAGSVIARKPGEAPPPGYTLFQRNEYNASLVWEEKAPVSVARRVYDGAVSLNGKIYLAGGYNSTDVFNIFETYDPLSNQWQTLPSLSEARVGLACAILEGKIFAISGHGKSSVEIYDPVANEWTSGPSLPEPIRYAEAITIDGRLFVMGGMNESDQNTNQVLELEKSTNQWITRAPMLRYTRGHRLVQVDGKIWAVGGYDSVGSDGSHSNKVEIYDPVNNSWEEGVPLNTARHFPNVWVSHGKVFAGGGFGGTFLNSVEVYNPVLNQWTLIGSLPESKFRAATVVNNHKVYIIAGEINSAVYSNKVYAADLPAPAMNLYFKEGNATEGAELSTLGMADGSVTLGQLAPDSLAKIGLDHNPATAEGSLFAVPWGTKALPGYSPYKRFDVSGSLKWEEKAPVIVPRWAFDGVEALDGKIYFVGGKDGAVRNLAERYDPATNEWESLTPMSEARDGMAAAVLNGKFYAIAGRNNNSVEIYDPQTEQWSLGPALPVPLYSAAAITINEKILVIGGYNSGNLNLVYEYESATNQWSQKASMPTARYGHKLAFANGKVWAIGGSSAKTVEIYDVANDSWSSGPSLSKNRFHTIAWSANGIIYVAGGSNDNTIEIYDPERNQWVDAGFLPEKKYTSDATVLNGKVYLVSGHNSSAYSENVHAADLNPPMDLYYREANASGTITLDKLSTELAGEFASSSAVSAPAGLVTAVDYNDDYPSDHTILERTDRNATYQWEEMASMPTSLQVFDGIEVVDGKIYCIGGSDGSNALDTTYRYDPVSDSWETLASMQLVRSGMSSAVLDGKIYAISGQNSGYQHLTVEVYDPSTNQWIFGPQVSQMIRQGAAITIDGRLFVMGGIDTQNSNSSSNLVWELNDERTQWISRSPMPVGKHGIKLVAFDGKILVYSGHILQVYHVASDAWEVKSGPNVSQHYPVFWKDKNALFMGGGISGGSWVTSSEKLDLNSFEWTNSGDLPEPKYAGGSVVDSDRVYILGGKTTSENYSNKVYSADLLPHRDLYFRSVASETVNRGPSAVYAVDELSASENQIVGAIVGEFNATDPDGDAVTYSLVSGAGDTHNALFTLDQNGTLKVAGALDYETADSLSIRVQAKDELNATKEGNFAVTLTDVYEDTDGDGFRDSLEASTGSDLNEPNSTPLEQGLVAWYPFDGNASDMSGNGNHGTVNGATLGTDRHGQANKAYSFDGVNDYINVGKFALSDFTLVSWVRINQFNQNNLSAIISRMAIANNGFELRIEPSGFPILVKGTGSSWSNINSNKSLEQSRWTFLTAISKGNFSEIYIDTNIANAERLSHVNSISDTLIGTRTNTANGGWLNGSIDDIRIYDRALSVEEVSALYRAESPNYFADAADHLEMIWVDSGAFTMGQNDISNASPEHNVTLTQGFYLGKYEVTQAQYEAVMRGNTNGKSAMPSQFSGNPSFPVEKVSWDDIQVFLARLNEQEADNLPQGWAYALPTEAEWEYACRAGTNTAYSWGDTISTTDANWNHGNDANRTEKVGSYLPNPWGFYDMHGNVCEWVADRYANYNPNIVFDPQGALTGNPVRRGGSWNMQGNFLLSSSRSFNNPSFRGVWVGFRLALKKVSFTPLTDDNFRTAIDLWFSDEAAAIETYSHISNWDVSQVTDFSGIFRERDTFNEDISAWDTSSATDMARLFYKATSFNQDISDWDTSSVTDFSQILREARSFDQNISAWDTSSVTSFQQAFWDANDFNGDIGDWDTSSAVDMAHMFRGASSFNQDVGGWDTSKVTSMHYIFYDAESFDQNIGDWDVSNIVDMRSMFEGATAFNGDISDWDTSSATHFRWMLKNAISFNQDIGDWNISSAETVMDMFNGAISFDQDISGWDISSEPSMTDMFGAEDGLSIYNKSKIQKSFAVSPRWGYEWEVNDPPHSLSEVEPLVVSTSQPIGTLIGTIRAENAEANETLEYAFVPMFDPFWAKNDNSMKVWLDAVDSSYIEQVNGSVIRWNNKAKQQPYLIPQEGGGNPTTGWRKHYGLNVLDFDGVSGLISPDAFDLGGNFSILMVAGIDQVDTNVDTLISSYRGGSPAHFYIRSAQEGVFNTRFQNNGMGSMRNFTPDSEMGPAIYEFIFNLEEEFLYCRINGEEYGKTGYWTAPDPFNYLRVFNKQGDGANRGYIDGFLAELLIFNKALLGGQRTEVENYLGAKWGIDVHIPKPTKNFELRANGEIYTTAVFDHDSEGDYEFQFRAMDEWNQTVEQALTIRVVNAVPDELNASGDLSVYENRPVGSIVSSFTGTDPDGDAFEIKLVDSNTTEAGNLFTIDQNGSLRTRVVLDYEIHGQTHPLVVEIVDEYGGKLVKEFAVSILNVLEDFDGDGIEDFYDLDDDNDGFTDEEEIAYGSNPNDRNSVANVAPEVPELFSELSMRENLPIGTYVGNVLAMDWDGDLREVWVVDVNGSVQESSFYIDTNGSLRTARILDFERTPVINFQILAIDEHNATTFQVFTLQIEDVYEPSEPNHLVEGAAGLEMIWVEPGSFLMGSPETEDAKHAIREQQHKVTLTQGYYLGKYEVTQEQYEKVMTGNASGLNAAPSKWKGSGSLPVEKVSVQDVKVFLERLNQSEHIAGRLRNGWAYVLPTEAEWEYACRAGTTSAYNFGDQISRNDANFENDISYPTVSVGQYLPNHWGFYDMHGNVAEWTSSYFGDYPLEAVIDPLGPLSGTNIVSRGGSWKNTADAVRSAVRIIAYTENQRVSHHGFRLAYKLITEPPHNLRTHDKLQVLENQPGGTFVGGFMSDEPNGDVIIYHLVDGDGDTHNDYFYIDKNGSLRSLIPLDYEVNPRALSIRVQARDSYLASTERTFRVELLDESELISDSVAGEGGWNVSDWFGTYLPFPSGWVYHETLRWVYLHPDQAGGYWIWQNVMGWLWTKSDLYPYLWSHEKKEWLYLLRSDEEGILYYKYSDKTIHQFNDKLDIPVSKYPKFSWDHIPRYMHTYKLTDFEQEELEYLAQFPLITIEKAQAIQQGGNDFVQRGTTVAAEGIKALNPDAKVLYYKNIIIDWHGSDATPALEAIENSYLKKTNGDFLTIGGRYRKYFDVSMPAVRNWWIEDATRMLNEPSIDGLFIDAHPKILYDWWLPQRGISQQKWEEVYAGYLTLLEKINLTFSSQNILLANLIRTSLSEQGGREHLHFFDGSYLEHFANDNLYDGKKADYIAMGINHVQQAAREGNIIAFTMKLGGEDGEEDLQSVDEVNLERLNYTTALFLVMAEKYSYFFPYGGTYGADAGRDATWMHTFPIFKKKLGPPKGPAVQEGYIYTREFENCRVILDIENEKGTLFWEEDSSR